MIGLDSSGRPFWRQPLLHFLLAGIAIFAINAVRDVPESRGGDTIIVTVAQVERMAGLWRKTWGRPASETELYALVQDHIREEVYYREALKLGLDINDTVIRRRLRQKMEFLTTSNAETVDPDDATLQSFYEQQVDKYRQSPIFDFEQIYFSNDQDGRLTRALATLNSGSKSEPLGDRISLPSSMSSAGETDIVRSFGAEFYTALQQLMPGTWSGPVRSGFGRHLVRISNIAPARIPALDEVRNTVENDWRAQQNAASLEATFQALSAAYDIEIEVPDE